MLLGGLGAFIAIAGVAGLIFLFQRDDGAVEVSQASVPTESAVTPTPDTADSQNQEAIKRELGGFVPTNPYAMVNWPKPVLENAAFDILKFVEPPPANENAAPFYLDALFEFSPELEPCFVGAPNLSDRLKAIKERVKLDRVFAKPYSTESAAEWKSTLKLYDEGFSKMAIAQRRPKCMFQPDFSYVTLVRPSSAAYKFGQIASHRATENLKEGDFSTPLQIVEMMLRLSRDLRKSNRSRLVNDGLEEIAESTIRKIFLAQGLNAEHCDQILSCLDRHFRELGDNTLMESQGMYVHRRVFVYELMSHTGFFSRDRMRDFNRMSGGGASFDSAESMFSSFAFSTFFSPNVKNPNESRSIYMEKFKAAAASTDLKREFQFIDQLFQSDLSLATKPFPQKWAEIRQRYEGIWVGEELDMSKFYLVCLDFYNSHFFYNNISDGTKLPALKALVALHQWRIKHKGTLPSSLEEVMKDLGYPDLPIDAFSNMPLRLTVLNGEPVIYSVGPNGVDEQAKIKSRFSLQADPVTRRLNDPTQSKGDLIFRLPIALK